MLPIFAPVAATIALASPTNQAQMTEARSVIPFTIDEIFGARPVIDAVINGRPYRLVIHANAGSYLQINHAEAEKVGARNLHHQGTYGISAPGQLSPLGRDDGVVDQLKIGDWSTPTAPVAVFEVPAGGSQGMLGLPFLYENKVVVDFARRVLMLPKDGSTASITSEMAARGYRAHPMHRDATDGRYLLMVTINGITAPMVVSTVATINLDTAFAERADVQTGKAIGTYGGPSGATGTIYRSENPIKFQINHWTSRPMIVAIEDSYAYSNAQRPADATSARGGALGADFMIQNGAVIDFGNSVLYLKDT